MSFYKVLLLSFFVLVSYNSHAQTATGNYENITTTAAQRLIDQGSTDERFSLLDVRTESEYQASHIQGSQNLDFRSENFTQQLAALDKQKTYVVYCRSGSRSGKTLDIMKKLGFKQAYNMQGGIEQWQDQSLPLLPN